ncbi:hypothetical protein GIB67_036204 [Kingdonia uniflora]|uniref:Uncharacterized protein n=1 Tax=Kingdonia uniflora TaxID=39325 RepID=A0A7J7L4R2_9MAGN|nr:hypothetical protein GIB67_036204 [Kingdonia uniflora]
MQPFRFMFHYKCCRSLRNSGFTCWSRQGSFHLNEITHEAKRFGSHSTEVGHQIWIFKKYIFLALI